jgi:FkbH-like protein
MLNPSITVASALRSCRHELAIALVEPLAAWEKYAKDLIGCTKDEFAERETLAFVDYLIAYFSSGDPVYRDLYLGEKLKQCYEEKNTIHEAVERRHQVTSADIEIITRYTQPRLEQSESASLVNELLSIQKTLTTPVASNCRILFVGDCLFVDLLGFLVAPLMELGIQIVPSFVTPKLITHQHRELRRLADSEFDLVFYSPLTYSFNLGFSRFQSLRAASFLPRQITETVIAAQIDIKSTLHVLRELYECPVFVHNSANLRRHDGSWREKAKTLFTSPARRVARDAMNVWLSAYVDGLDSKVHRFSVLDETIVLKGASSLELSEYFYNAGLQHPARFSRALAPIYEDIIVAQAILSKKKVVICDLDNTLWKGVIGEGTVTHYHERQHILKQLREKGMLLAICSKNDPKNVHWRGGVLSEDDFVCQQINWDSKAGNIRNIAEILNLKTKDFIFLDDRADERELAKMAISDLTTMDADSTKTWRQLAHLQQILETSDGDRTAAYKQRAAREEFIGSSLSTENQASFDDIEALKKLDLRVNIRVASKGELKRVTELINRTNQFNMCGTRTTLQEVTKWHDSAHHSIIVADAEDRFGPMGTISVAILEKTARGVEISAFVLSCRVFGFGMEHALLSYVTEIWPGVCVYGHYKETPYNEPCRKTYPESGFAWHECEWVFSGYGNKPKFDWLTITCEKTKAIS